MSHAGQAQRRSQRDLSEGSKSRPAAPYSSIGSFLICFPARNHISPSSHQETGEFSGFFAPWCPRIQRTDAISLHTNGANGATARPTLTAEVREQALAMVRRGG
jgi:hypothetical protein